MDKEALDEGKSVDNSTLYFLKKVSQYFMDFLETDFHKRKIPKRNIKLRNSDNFLIGLNLKKYPSFEKLVWKAVGTSFSKESLTKITKGIHTTNIPENLLDLIKLQTAKITKTKIDTIVASVSEEVEKNATLYKKEYSKALSTSLDEARKIVDKDLTIPLIQNLEKSLTEENLGDENAIFLMEEELGLILLKLLEDSISESLKLLISENKIILNKEIGNRFTLKDVKNSILEFFDDFKVTDLYSEVYEIDRNRNILDKQEFYLYFGDITYNKAKYPIFYIPFSIVKEGDSLLIEFDSQVYINKRALEFIVQEYNSVKERSGHLKLINERIIYLAQDKESFLTNIQKIVDEIVDLFDLDSTIDLKNPETQNAKSLLVRASNTSYISLFDKSDEALINDYEEILQVLESEENSLAGAFGELIKSFIYKDPEPFTNIVQDEWGESDTSEKLVYPSPIPLNSEQRQILVALNKEDCKYITVEGPPGTGKSHTITAIICEAILKNKSVLVLSDKKEALDVVENKISETLNKVRFDQDFQNPILRLGKTGSTYSQILSASSIEKIKTNFKAVKQHYPALEETIGKATNTLKEDIDAEILSYDDIKLPEIQELINLETTFSEKECHIDLEEAVARNESDIELIDIRNIFKGLNNSWFSEDTYIKTIRQLLGFEELKFNSIEEFLSYFDFLKVLQQSFETVKKVFGDKLITLNLFEKLSLENASQMESFIKKYSDLKLPVLGYMFNKKKVELINFEFLKTFPSFSGDSPVEKLSDLKMIMEVFEYVNKLQKELNSSFVSKTEYINLLKEYVSQDKLENYLTTLFGLKEDILYLRKQTEFYPKTYKKMQFVPEKLESYFNNHFLVVSDADYDKLIRFISLKKKIIKDFGDLPEIMYPRDKKNIENLVTARMTYLMDQRVSDFYETNRNTAKAIREIIRTKRQFPKNEFEKLKSSFPCILAGIRDYAEYIPLEADIFDLLIIDEASQVSIAQAFPALLRAKKVVILGDRKQFSNIKSSQARTETNKEYLNDLQSTFKKYVSREQTHLVKLEKFNIRTSILEFMEFISNYNIQLLKHFRCYKEIISYSNKHFYQDDLQVMKIRGKPIDDVLRFHYIKHDGKAEVIPNTNKLEVDYIVAQLKKLIDGGNKQSVGIITPHTNQQKLLIETISNLPEKDTYFDDWRLKIMTFDTCQGEERDILFYSMVATEEDDRLGWIFIKDLNSIDMEEEGKIKAQRLNVGFSRGKEQINLILSKSVDKYSGEIGAALRHYDFTLNEAKKEPLPESVDKNSPMEKKVLNWLIQTDFYKNNKENVEIRPQFDLGKYLKQLDRTYNHPNYVVDFLIIYKDERLREYKFIIEYDGFEYHFSNTEEVDKFNYQTYYNESDVYREKVLESYGYKIIRLNRFNLGGDEIATIDKKLKDAVKEPIVSDNWLTNIEKTFRGIENGEMRECPKCDEIKPSEDFKDNSLITGYGRFCRECKGIGTFSSLRTDVGTYTKAKNEDLKCPKCQSTMVLRTGRYGKFYGCSRYPYCKGTRKYGDAQQSQPTM